MDIVQIVAVVLVFLLAGGVKGVTGMGLPTVAMSLLGLWMAPAQAAGLLVAPSLLTNIAQCKGPRWRELCKRLWPAWLALLLATMLGPGLGDHALAFDARRPLGIALVAYGVWGLWRPALPDWSRRSMGKGLLAGLATGLVTALTGVFVVPLVPYLQTLRLDKQAMVQALGLSFTVATLSLAARLQVSGGMVFWSASTLLALGAALCGLWIGARVRAGLSAAAFQRALFVVFIALGLANLYRGG